MIIRWKAVEQYLTVVLFVFNFPQFIILKHLAILSLALSGVKGLRDYRLGINEIMLIKLSVMCSLISD